MLNDSPSLPSELLIIGPRNSRRVAEFVQTVQKLATLSVKTQTYEDVIENCLDSPPRSGTLIRLESPGGCTFTMRALLKAGISRMADYARPITAEEIDQLECERGEMLHPRQFFLGLREVLRRLDTAWKGLNLSWMSTCDAIVTAFDKAACLERWALAGLPIPEQYPGLTSYSQIRAAIPDRHARIFVKLRYGYSAMGAVALEWRGDLVRAITTTEVCRDNNRTRMFITKRPVQMRCENQIAWLIDTLGLEGIIVEDWLPKARWMGRPYDLRIVVIRGNVRHVVGRANASPFTNLNLDAKRLSRQIVEQQLGNRWERLEWLCERGASELPGAGMLGLDVLVSPGCREFTLLEANAFGDYLPGLTDQGQSVYEAQLKPLSTSGI